MTSPKHSPTTSAISLSTYLLALPQLGCTFCPDVLPPASGSPWRLSICAEHAQTFTACFCRSIGMYDAGQRECRSLRRQCKVCQHLARLGLEHALAAALLHCGAHRKERQCSKPYWHCMSAPAVLLLWCPARHCTLLGHALCCVSSFPLMLIT